MFRVRTSYCVIFSALFFGLGAHWKAGGNLASQAILTHGISEVTELRGTLHPNSNTKTLRDARSNLILVTESGAEYSLWCSRPLRESKCLESATSLPSSSEVVSIKAADYKKFGLKDLVIIELTLESGYKAISREDTLWKAQHALERSPAWAFTFSVISLFAGLVSLIKNAKKKEENG